MAEERRGVHTPQISLPAEQAPLNYSKAGKMKRKKQVFQKISFLIIVVMFVSLACSVPGLDGIGKQLEPVEQTANALSTSVVATQTALALGMEDVQEIVEEAIPEELPELPDELEVPEELEDIPGEGEIPEGVDVPGGDGEAEAPDIAHTTLPGEPGKVEEEISDSRSSETASQKHAPAFSDKHEYNIFERPFTPRDMNYRPDVDIQKAEITTDGVFYYVTIYLEAVDTASGAAYAVELDTDKDGRGDYLVWTYVPQVQEWKIDGVSVMADINNDVGAKVALRTDAPTTGTGYDTLLFSAMDYSDPDTAWSRLAPGNPKAVQIAFKKDFLDNKSSFLWSVWADGGLMDPARFDYNDFFTLEEAGSPLEDNDHYPVLGIHTVDNTCRMGFGSVLTGSEPGLCGEAETVTVPTTQAITPPPIDIPGGLSTPSF